MKLASQTSNADKWNELQCCWRSWW